jgi:hypothetical protein
MRKSLRGELLLWKLQKVLGESLGESLNGEFLTGRVTGRESLGKSLGESLEELLPSKQAGNAIVHYITLYLFAF